MGISQAELIHRSGLTGIVNWENVRHQRLPDDPSMVFRIAAFFSVDPRVVFKMLPHLVCAQNATEASLLFAFRSMSPPDRRAFLRDMGWVED